MRRWFKNTQHIVTLRGPYLFRGKHRSLFKQPRCSSVAAMLSKIRHVNVNYSTYCYRFMTNVQKAHEITFHFRIVSDYARNQTFHI